MKNLLSDTAKFSVEPYCSPYFNYILKRHTTLLKLSLSIVQQKRVKRQPKKNKTVLIHFLDTLT